MQRFVIPMFGVVCAAGTVSAAPSLYEGFDLPANTGLSGLGSGDGWNGNWESAQQAAFWGTFGSGLNYNDGMNDLVTVGGSIREARQDETRNRRGYDATGLYADGSEVWVSLLVNVQPGDGDARIFAFSRENNLFNGVGFSIGGDGNISLRAIEGSPSSFDIFSSATVSISDGQTRFVVGRFVFSDSGMDEFAMWINPGLGSAPSLADAVTLSADVSPDSSWNEWWIRSNTFATGIGLDEFRMGSSFADVAPVVPGPGTSALALTALGFAARRRR